MIAVGMVHNPSPRTANDGPPKEAIAVPSGRRGTSPVPKARSAVAGCCVHMATRVGMGEAQRWIAVCDGGSGLEDLL